MAQGCADDGLFMALFHTRRRGARFGGAVALRVARYGVASLAAI